MMNVRKACAQFKQNPHGCDPMNDTIKPDPSLPGNKYLVAALYKFVALREFQSWQAPLLEVCKKNRVMGTLLLAKEGLNGTISGSIEGIGNVLEWLKGHGEFADLDVKFSHANNAPFYRMKVRLKKEIVTLGVEGVDPTCMVGTYVKPREWNALIEQEDVILVDTRNDYEVAIGTFKGAKNPQTDSFRDFPKWVEQKLEAQPDTKIAMFCTGGIRSTALLKSRGFENVFHLKGGILKYLEEIPESESLWEGECFVFDQRVAVKHGLEQGKYDQCHACRMPVTVEDKQHESYKKGVSCHHCFEGQNETQRARFAERQKQMELAKKHNKPHIAANVEAARDAKRALKEKQRELNRLRERQ